MRKQVIFTVAQEREGNDHDNEILSSCFELIIRGIPEQIGRGL
jgi:hypothetical protein